MKKSQQRLLAICLCLLLATAFLTGCSAKTEESAASEAPMDYGEMAAEMPSAPPQVSEPESGVLDTTGGSAQNQAVADPSQKIIYSALLQLETTAFDEAMGAVDKLVVDYGGFVERANVDGSTVYQPDGTTRVENRTAQYTLRVPSAKFEAALKQAGSIGNVTSSSRDAQNITSVFIDNEARRDSLQVQEDRLLTMLEKSEDVETLVALESRLSEVRYELESIERQLRNWQTQVDFSTIALSMQEVAIYTPTAPVQRSFGEKLSTALSDGMTRFGRSMQNLTISLAGALPVLLLLVALAIVGLLITRRLVRKRRAANQPTEQPPEQKDGH